MARIHAVADGRKSLAKPTKKLFWMMTVPSSPMSSRTTPFQASRPASVTTNDGTPTFVMISPCRTPMARPASERDDHRRAGARTRCGCRGRSAARSMHARHAADEADRQVDLPQQQDEDDPHADRRDRRRLDDEVDEVPRGQEVRVLALEDDRDDDQADDDRQRAEVAGLDARPPAARRRRRGSRRSGAAAAGAPGPPSTGAGAVALMRSPPRRRRGPWTACRR